MITAKNEQEVEAFLREFKPKFSIWGIIFLHRDKNEEALRALGITPVAREEIIKKIEKEDYSHSIIDEASFGDMWVFGKDYDGTELYIKAKLSVSRFMRQSIPLTIRSKRNRLWRSM